jgi:flagellar basal-body rod modification protein FlgD
MSAISGISGTDSKSLQSQFMTLLVEQMKNQDPLNPMDNSQMTSQLAQLSQLDQLEGVNSKFDKVLALTQMNQSTGLVGKLVTFSPDGQTQLVGMVNGLTVSGGKVSLRVGQYDVDPDTVLAVSNGTSGNLALGQMSQAADMIGKTVTYSTDGGKTLQTGIVDSVALQNGQLTLQIGSQNVDPATVSVVTKAN